MRAIGKFHAVIILVGLACMPMGTLTACNQSVDVTEDETPSSIETDAKTTETKPSNQADDGRILPPVEIVAEDIGRGARIVAKMTVDEPTQIKVSANMTTGDLGVIIQTIGASEKVWEERLEGNDEKTATIEAGEYYVVGIGGDEEAKGTVTVESVE